MNARSYGSLMTCLGLHSLGIAVSIGGLILVNALDMAMFNTNCMHACGIYSYQYLNLMMLVFGITGFLACLIFILMVEFLILKESRTLNIYLENRK